MLRLHGVNFADPRIPAACRKAGVLRVFLFGSILTDPFGPDSDIEVRIDTDLRNPPGLLTLGGLQMDLSELLGRTVHLTLLSGVPASERPAVLANARVLDAA